MQLDEVIGRRRMVRSFLDQPLQPGDVDRIIANGLRAPSAGFTQGWAFVVLDGRDQTERYWSASFATSEARQDFHWPGLFQAPLLILALADEIAYRTRYAEPDKLDTGRPFDWPVPWWFVDTAFASLLMLLTAVDRGLGACFFGVVRPEAVVEALAVPPRYAPVGTIAVGYPGPDDRPSASARRGRRPAADVVHRGRW